MTSLWWYRPGQQHRFRMLFIRCLQMLALCGSAWQRVVFITSGACHRLADTRSRPSLLTDTPQVFTAIINATIWHKIRTEIRTQAHVWGLLKRPCVTPLSFNVYSEILITDSLSHLLHQLSVLGLFAVWLIFFFFFFNVIKCNFSLDFLLAVHCWCNRLALVKEQCVNSVDEKNKSHFIYRNLILFNHYLSHI